MTVISEADESRFWGRVNRRGCDECWTWNGHLNGGYGVMNISGKAQKAHRISFRLSYGPIPDGKMVCHHCDNPSCVNPTHLYAGTHADNMRDREKRGRGGFLRMATGERHSQAKLSWVQVCAIRDRFASGNIEQRSLADEFGVSRSTIHRIVRNELWVAP